MGLVEDGESGGRGWQRCLMEDGDEIFWRVSLMLKETVDYGGERQ